MKQSWQVERSRKQCASCMVEFVEGTPFFSALYSLKAGELGRRDFCMSCWRKMKDTRGDGTVAPEDGPEAGLISFWKTRVKPAPQKKQRLSFEPHVALSVFNQVQQREEKSPDELRLAFVLALSLARRKMLVIDGTERRDGKSFIKARRRGGEEYGVEDPGLSEQDILSMLDKVGELLEMNLSGNDEDGLEPGEPETDGDEE